MKMPPLEPLNKTITMKMQYDRSRVDVKCPMCDKTDWEVRDDIRPPILDSHLVICKTCGFISYNPQLRYIESHYRNELIPQSISMLQTKNNKIKKHRKLLFNYLDKNKVKIKRVLDYGGSDGYLGVELKKEYPDLEYVNVEPNRGHRKWSKLINGFENSYESINKVDGKFDLIIMYHCLEHLQEPDNAIRKVREMLNDKGLIYIAVPTITRCDYGALDQIMKDEHINLFTDDTLKYFLNKNGLEEVFEDNRIYGTCLILKKNDEFHELIDRSYYKENLELLMSLRKCFVLKDQMDNHMKSGRVIEAKQCAISALKAYDKYPELISKYASLHDGIDEQDILEDYLSKYPQFIDLKIQLASCYYKDKELGKARKLFEEHMEAAGESPVALQHLSYISYYEKDVAKALEYAKRLVERDPYNLASIEYLGYLITRM